MKVKELIEILKKMPMEAEIYHLWDGEPRTKINVVYESRIGNVITSDFGEYCYGEENKPVGADDEWRIPEKPKIIYHIDTQTKLSKKRLNQIAQKAAEDNIHYRF